MTRNARYLLPVIALIAPLFLFPVHAPAAEADGSYAVCDPNNPDGSHCEPRSAAATDPQSEMRATEDVTQDVATGRPIQAEDLPIEAIERIVREYLLEHPEVLLEAQQVLRARFEAEEANRAEQAIAAHANELYSDPDAPVGGNPDGTITLVEFFDYRCGHCRNVKSVLDEVLASHEDVRIVYKEFPILGPESVIAAQAALAARAQGKYVAFHDALMVAEGRFDRAYILEVAESVGIDVERLSSDMDDPAVVGIIERNHRLARALGVKSTPNFVLEGRLIQGAPSLQQLTAMIAEVRTARAE